MEPLYRMQVERKKKQQQQPTIVKPKSFCASPMDWSFCLFMSVLGSVLSVLLFFLSPLCTEQTACNTNGSSKYTVAQKISSAKSRPDKLKNNH